MDLYDTVVVERRSQQRLAVTEMKGKRMFIIVESKGNSMYVENKSDAALINIDPLCIHTAAAVSYN